MPEPRPAVTLPSGSLMSSVETIASLAMLKVNADAQGHDYLDYLVPFVCQIIGHQAGQAINVLDVRKGLREQFGLRLPAGPVELVLKRLARRKVLANTSGVYVVGPKFKSDDFAVRRDSARASIERVVGSLIKIRRRSASANHR